MEIQEGLVLPVIVGLVAVAKAQNAPVWLLPLGALVLGIAAALVVFPAPTPAQSVIKGLVYGLMASGLWSGTKAVMGK